MKVMLYDFLYVFLVSCIFSIVLVFNDVCVFVYAVYCLKNV